MVLIIRSSWLFAGVHGVKYEHHERTKYFFFKIFLPAQIHCAVPPNLCINKTKKEVQNEIQPVKQIKPQ